MARGAYWRELGNTPGHLNHWSKRSFVRLLVAATARSSRCARRSPGRCCLSASRTSAAKPASAARQAALLRQRRADPLDRDRLDRAADVRLLLDRQPRARRSRRPSAIDLLWSVMFVIISVIYRPIEQLLSRTIAERRARGHAQHTLRVPMLIQASFALLFLVARARRSTNSCVDDVFDHNAALYWMLVVGTLAYAASYFARGWLAGHERFGLFGGLVLMESFSRAVLRARRRAGHRQRRRRRSRSASPRRRSSRWSSCRPRSRAGERRASRESGSATTALPPITVDEADAALAGPGHRGRAGDGRPRRALAAPRRRLRGLGVGDHARRADAAERGRADGRRDRDRRARWRGSCSTCC